MIFGQKKTIIKHHNSKYYVHSIFINTYDNHRVCFKISRKLTKHFRLEVSWYFLVVSYSQWNVLTGHHCVLEIIRSVMSWCLYHLSFQKTWGCLPFITLESLDDMYYSKFSTGCNPHVLGWRPQTGVSSLQLDVGCPVVIAAAIPDAVIDGRMRVWRHKNTAYSPRNIQPTVPYGWGSVMVWGCISHDCKLDLVVIQGNLTGDTGMVANCIRLTKRCNALSSRSDVTRGLPDLGKSLALLVCVCFLTSRLTTS
jgi:hypothetical protein